MNKEPSIDSLKKIWDEYGEAITVFAIVLSILAAAICIGFGIFEWQSGKEALENAKVVGQKGSDHLVDLGGYGSFLQGTTASLWALAGFCIIFVAFLIQAVQLAEQRKQFKIQSDSVIQQNFESRFFELLGYHRQNVSEIGIGEKTGQRVFVSLIREFRETLDRVNEVCKTIAPTYLQDKRLDLAYSAFYYGVGPNSTRLLREALSSRHDPQLVEALITKLEEVQNAYRYHIANPPAQKNEPLVHKHYKDYLASLTRPSFCPFDGHQSRLGHYYRHLYQIVKYAAHHAPNGDAAEYADLIRAQLSNHEQGLFCLNALSRIGSAWIQLGYINDFELIKNIPRNFFDPVAELDIEKQFPKIKFEFYKTNNEPDEPNRT